MLLIIASIIATFPLFYFLFKVDSNDKGLDTPTQGSITLFAENSCLALTEKLVKEFEKTYPKAHIVLTSGNERDAFNALYEDSSRLVILPRKLSEPEVRQFQARHFVPRSNEFASRAGQPLVLFNNQARIGLGQSFSKFVSSDAAQSILHEFGLSPVISKKLRKAA